MESVDRPLSHQSSSARPAAAVCVFSLSSEFFACADFMFIRPPKESLRKIQGMDPIEPATDIGGGFLGVVIALVLLLEF